MPDIKIKRYADKENLKKLVKYSKDTFANKSEINEKFYTKEQIDTMLESGSGDNYYTKSEIDTKLNSKANKTTTLSGYGITDAYTKTQVDKKVSDLVNSAPETLDTLNELASALGNDSNFATTIATQIGNKANDSDVAHKSGDETIAGSKTFTSNIVGNVTGTATKLATVRTIALSGGATGTATGFDGSGNITIPVTALDASKLTGIASVSTTGNAATATNADHATNADSANRAIKLKSNSDVNHNISFDWSRQISGCIGIRVDATDLGGIVTTDNSTAVIRAQWYAAYPDGPEAHNAMWGGRDITAAFNNGTVSANIANGTFKDIFPGDYIRRNVTVPRVLADDGTTVLHGGGTYTVNWVIADCDYWINKGNTAMTTHHVAIVPQVSLFNTRMNSANSTEGGYAGSEMYKKIIPACARGIVNAFGSSHILTFRDIITNSVDTSHVSSGIPLYMGTTGISYTWVPVQCNMMSEKMVYGAPICASGAADNIMAVRQMSAFRLSEKLINYNRNWWWLRDVGSSSFFAHAGGHGLAFANDASFVLGVRPFALLV